MYKKDITVVPRQVIQGYLCKLSDMASDREWNWRPVCVVLVPIRAILNVNVRRYYPKNEDYEISQLLPELNSNVKPYQMLSTISPTDFKSRRILALRDPRSILGIEEL